MRKVENVPDELVVHIEAVEEFLGIKNSIYQLGADFRFQFAYAFLDFSAFHLVADNKQVHPGVVIFDEYTGNQDKLDPADFFEVIEKFVLVQAAGAHQKVLELGPVLESGIEKPVGRRRTLFYEVNGGEEFKLPAGNVGADAAPFDDILALEAFAPVEQEKPHNFYPCRIAQYFSQNFHFIY